MTATGRGRDIRWRAPDGRTADPRKVCERLVDLLAQTGELQRWPETQSHIDGVAQRLGPYKIHLVSVFPDVAILVPHDYGPLKNRSNWEIRGSREGAFGDRRILNHIYYGTSAPITTQAYWISSDLGIPLTPITVTAEHGFAVAHPKIELIGQPSGAALSVVRIR